MNGQISRTKTSVDILDERNVLRVRVHELEAQMVAIRRETDHALRIPEMSLLTVCRIRTIARRAMNAEDD